MIVFLIYFPKKLMMVVLMLFEKKWSILYEFADSFIVVLNYNKISYLWKQKLTPKSLESSKHYGKFLADRQRQARSFSICTILPKSPKLITLSRNQNRKNRSTRKSREWPQLRNVLKRHRYSILSSHNPNVPPFIPWISSQKERHSR